MSPLDTDFEVLTVGRVPDSRTRDQHGQKQSRDNRDGAALLDPTIDYPPNIATVPKGLSSSDPPRWAGRYDFLDPPRADNELGHLAHYRVRKLIGEGGMGLVFLAEDTDLSRPVAVKVIKPEQASAPGICERFLREARSTAAINHNHIVTIYHVGLERKTPYLAMEYLQGVSLARWIEQGRRLTTGQVLRIGREMAAGLSAAHRIGLVHRDIKPANIWLEAPSGRVKILDFGLSRSLYNDVTLTQSGMIIGTPKYMSPEQARGEIAGPESDLFSLGCVLYRLCAGAHPFPGTTIMAVLTALALHTPRSLRELDSGVPPALDDLVLQLLAKHPGDRPASAQAVVEAIKAIERELWTNRQRSVLSAATPQPAGPHALQQDQADPTERPGNRRVSARSGTWHICRWIVASVLAMAAIAAGLATALNRKNTLGASATGANPIARLIVDRGRSITTNGMEERRRVQFKAEPDQLSQPDHHGAVTKSSSPTAPQQSAATATTRPGEMTPVRPASDDPARPEVLAILDRPASSSITRELAPGKDRPGELSPQKERSRERREQELSVKDDWTALVDPDGDCEFDQKQPERKIRISVPGTPHLLSAELGRMNAPRLLRNVHGNFDALVTVAGVFHTSGRTTVKEYPPYHGAGILLWQDGENYVRLEIAEDLQHGKPRPYVNFEYRKDSVLAASRGQRISDGSSYLRMRRRGDEIHAAFGPDGVHWTSFPPLTVKLKDWLNIGVSAINTATKPLTAELTDFMISGPLEVKGDADTPMIKP